MQLSSSRTCPMELWQSWIWKYNWHWNKTEEIKSADLIAYAINQIEWSLNWVVNETNHRFNQSFPFRILCKPSKFSYKKHLLIFFSQILQNFGQSIIPMIIHCFIMFGILGVRIECQGMMETSGSRSHLVKPSETWQWHFKGFDLIKLSTIQSPTGPLKWLRFLIKLRGSYERMFGVGRRQASHDTWSEAAILLLMAPRIWQNVTFTASNH